METKTAKVRIEVQNTQNFELKPDMYATVKISSPVTVYDVAVPDESIIRSGERNVVVIALGGGYFDPRDVKLGLTAEGYVQILDGIREGEKIVVSSQFLIDSESNLKAAISQMAGHAGMDMSKPMEEEEAGGAEHEGHQMNDRTKSGGHTGHELNQQPAKKVKRAQGQQGAREMQDARGSGHQGHDMKDMKTAVSQKRIDPVCGMEAQQKEELSYTHKGTKYYFCSTDDLEKFKVDPEKYVGQRHQQ